MLLFIENGVKKGRYKKWCYKNGVINKELYIAYIIGGVENAPAMAQQESPLRGLIKMWRRPTFPPRTRILVFSES